MRTEAELRARLRQANAWEAALRHGMQEGLGDVGDLDELVAARNTAAVLARAYAWALGEDTWVGLNDSEGPDLDLWYDDDERGNRDEQRLGQLYAAALRRAEAAAGGTP